MSNSFFKFKQFIIHQDRCAMKVTTDACLFGSLSPTPACPAGRLSAPIAIGREKNINVLDIGTGTGLLALMYAQKNQGAIIDAIEIDKDAAAQAKENAERSPWGKSINVINADARKFSFYKKYDLIISNPPFYENDLKSNNNRKDIAHHSKELSLQELLQIVKTNLDKEGQFYLLLPKKRMEEAEFLFGRPPLEITILTMVRQSESHNIFRIFIQGKHRGNAEADYKKNEIIIWDEQQQYTPEFIESLKDFYLNL